MDLKVSQFVSQVFPLFLHLCRIVLQFHLIMLQLVTPVVEIIKLFILHGKFASESIHVALQGVLDGWTLSLVVIILW